MSDNSAQVIQRAFAEGIVLSTANPGPLGLYGFALTTFLLQGVFTGAVDASTSNLVYAMGFFFGGLAQFTAGLLEYHRKNTFATTAFCCYGAFWMAIALNGTLKAAGIYTTAVDGEQMMLSLWGILTFLLWLCTFRSTVMLSALFFTLSLLFWFLAGGLTRPTLLKFGGGWGMLVAVLAFYCGTAQLMEEAYGRAILPVWPLAEVTYCKPTWPSATLGKAYTSLKNMSPVKGRRDNRVDIEVSAV